MPPLIPGVMSVIFFTQIVPLQVTALAVAITLGLAGMAYLVVVDVNSRQLPPGTPPNALVQKPGRYRFLDYLKVGSGLTLVCLGVALGVIPWKCPTSS